MTITHFVFVGPPVSAPRPRATRQGHIYMPKEYMQHKKNLVYQLQKQINLTNHQVIKDPVKIEINFIYPRPKYLGGSDIRIKDTKPDIDNLVKTILDVLTDAKIWIDDNLVSSITASKFYGIPDFVGQTEITITHPWHGGSDEI